MFLAVFAAFAIQDKGTDKILETWWDGNASENIIFNTRDRKKDKQNKRLTTHISKNRAIIHAGAEPFLVTQYPNEHKFEINHQNFTEFYVIGYYYGRSTFSAKIPHNWENHGLAGFNVFGFCSLATLEKRF